MQELPEFEVFTPSTLGDVLTFLSGKGKGSKLLAGGTTLIPGMRQEGVRVSKVVDLSGLGELRYIRRTGGTIRVGGLTTIDELAAADLLDERYYCLKRMRYLFGSLATRNMATVGGNLAAGPEGDLAEILLALDGRVAVRSASGGRVAGPADLELAEDEVIVEAQFDELEGRVATWFNKLEKRRENRRGITKTTTLLRLSDDGTVANARIAVSRAKGKRVGRATMAESELVGRVPDGGAIRRALDTLESEIAPAGDHLGSARFRKSVTRAMVGEGLANCLKELADRQKMGGLRGR
jgi:CO/xanthine dehydrogenase FAD-binding subunit